MVKFLAILSFIFLPVVSFAGPAGSKISGSVKDANTRNPLPGVVLSLGDDYLWSVTDESGMFAFDNVQKGTYTLKVSYLGYVDELVQVDARQDCDSIVVLLRENSLALEEVVVTAQRAKDGLSTSHTLGRDALNHLQMSNMSDMASLLPGGKTVNPDLTTSNVLSLRDGGSSEANAAFGIALVVDGVRLGNNAGLAGMTGVDTRSISVENIESVEVITGVPSAEYGDLNSGMVKVRTKRGRTPYNVTMSVNPRTWQLSASKGFDLKKDRGVLNASLEWARATKQLISPYESYSRKGITLNYSNTFGGANLNGSKLRFEAGLAGNIGGMNSKDDPDAFSGEFSRVNDNSLRSNISMTWLLNKSWITNLKFDASLNYQDNLSRTHSYHSNASQRPAIHSTQNGYFLSSQLPLEWFDDYMVDSKELDLASELKYEWTRRTEILNSRLKAGAQWKANANMGLGEYYMDPSLAAHGFRNRSFRQYPFMHNLSVYIEESLGIKIAQTKLNISAGVRMENVFIKGSDYRNTSTWSPRFNAKWDLCNSVSVRAGWGITEKLPSFFILYPKQEYWDKEVFEMSYGKQSANVYYTLPYQLIYNPGLKWQRNSNSELGIDFEKSGFRISAVGFYNITFNPYQLSNSYSVYSYTLWRKPSDFEVGTNPQIKVDYNRNGNGEIYVRNSDDEFWTLMEAYQDDKIFVRNTEQKNGTPMKRAGGELTIDFPEIRPIRTSFRADASYSWTRYEDSTLSSYYRGGSYLGRSYKYLGFYPNGNKGNSLVCGKISHSLDANITSITHIPQAKLIITCRLEMSLLKRSRNIAAPGSTANEQGYMELWPTKYMSVEDGIIRDFTQEDKSNPELSNLMLTSSNIYTFRQDGYGFYCSANLSITKEIGKHVSLSFFANNFTNSRPYVLSKATGIGAIFTPAFYYGLTCRLKF